MCTDGRGLRSKHFRPQSPSFLGHVVGKRGALDAAVTDVRKFLTSCRAWGKFYFLSSLQRVASLGCLKMHHFTQLGFTDNLENLKKTVTEAG